MSKLSPIFITLLVFLVFSNGFAGEEKIDISKLNDGLFMAIKSDNQGLQASAMMLIIQYSDDINIDPLANDIYNFYFSDKNDNFRHLALIALYKMNNKRLLKNLYFDIDKESNPIIHHQIATILNSMPPLVAGY